MRTIRPIIIFLCLMLYPDIAFSQVEIEVNQSADKDDDYLCWSPVKCRIRNAGGTSPLDVTLTSSKPQSVTTPTGDTEYLQGEVVFLAGSAAPTWVNFNHTDSLSLSLPAGGGWVDFWLGGVKASRGEALPDGTVVNDGKDTLILVDEAGGGRVASHPVMVRIRKNAEKLTVKERDRFLTAVAKLHDMDRIGAADQNSGYLKYVKVHGDAFTMGIHNVPVFAPWHRIMLLSYERDLQAVDKRVALPYWKFDEAAPKLFSEDFIGRVGGGSRFVQLSSDNPLSGWKMPSNFALEQWTFGTPPCLLYTSPSPRDGLLSRMPSSA